MKDNDDIKKCICKNCKSDDNWKIINDKGTIIGWCSNCGHKTIVGKEIDYE
jgi:RNase P subunit RPR2